MNINKNVTDKTNIIECSFINLTNTLTPLIKKYTVNLCDRYSIHFFKKFSEISFNSANFLFTEI